MLCCRRVRENRAVFVWEGRRLTACLLVGVPCLALSVRQLQSGSKYIGSFQVRVDASKTQQQCTAFASGS